MEILRRKRQAQNGISIASNRACGTLRQAGIDGPVQKRLVGFPRHTKQGLNF